MGRAVATRYCLHLSINVLNMKIYLLFITLLLSSCVDTDKPETVHGHIVKSQTRVKQGDLTMLQSYNEEFGAYYHSTFIFPHGYCHVGDTLYLLKNEKQNQRSCKTGMH